MEFIIFRHSDYEKLYRCTYDISTAPLEKRAHKIHGSSLIAISTFFVLVYIPTLLVMYQYLKKTAYQLMIVIGLSDVFILTFVVIPYGIMTITGDVFCSHPTLSYIIGCVSGGLWVLSTEMSCILALYRCLELWRPFVADALFRGNKTLVWVGLSFTHLFVTASFGMPIIYSSFVGSMMLNPHAGYIDDAAGIFSNLHRKLYNIALFFVLIGLYITFAYLIISQRRLTQSGPSRQVIAAQQKSLIQALVICSCATISDAYWTIIFTGQSPSQMVCFVGMYIWICGHGIPGLIYISMNRTVRSSLLRIIDFKLKKSLFSISRKVEQVRSQTPL
ncbi:serpentine type 7TM GPCR chemoreceptor srt domain-containing protein [Ditylenchus destructor]|nr:serpentine type 7TM GPCR chemoreceptor srt domain-containing protein [Ditylenchus destructor]